MTEKLPNRDTPLEDIIENAIAQGADSEFIKELVRKGEEIQAESSTMVLITVVGWVAREGIDWKAFATKAMEEGEPFGCRMAPSLILAAKAFSHKLALEIYALGVAFGFIVFPKIVTWNEREGRWVTLVK